MDTTGAVATFTTRIDELKRETAADDAAVRDLTSRAAQKRRDARLLYQQALADSAGHGVTRSPGCPVGGYCYHLVQRSRGLDNQAAALDQQAGLLLDTQRGTRDARTAEQADLTRQVGEQRDANSSAIRADSGFGARTSAMWYLVTNDFWGVGVFYLGITLLLVALDCAAVGLKFVSLGNAYERNEARTARRREHEAALLHEREIHDARNYGAAMAMVVAEGIESAVHDERVARSSAERASEVLRTCVVVPEGIRKLGAHGGRHHRPLHAELVAPDAEDVQPARNGRHRRTLRTPVIVSEELRALPGDHHGRHNHH
jgi:hypothetical protein